MLSNVRTVSIRLIAAVLLTLCVGVHILEASGRWDGTFADANDEAGIVAVVLCIGIAIAVAGSVLARLFAHTRGALIAAPPIGSLRLPVFRFPLPASIAGPPLIPLRI